MKEKTASLCRRHDQREWKNTTIYLYVTVCCRFFKGRIVMLSYRLFGWLLSWDYVLRREKLAIECHRHDERSRHGSHGDIKNAPSSSLL